MKNHMKDLLTTRKKTTNIDARFEREIDVIPICFIHIPKTAGTSFRKALEQKQLIEKDYGQKSAETTDLVLENVYQTYEPYYFSQILSQRSISGHIHLNKYSNSYDIRNLITFVREPFSQIISHFNHYVNHNNYKGDFVHFYKQKQFINLQSKMLRTLPLSLIGHTGVTEYYKDSVELINASLSLDMDILSLNQNSKSIQSFDNISEQEKKEILKLNGEDFSCYQAALQLHKLRMSLYKQKKEWVYLHGEINSNNALYGCAYYEHSDEPVELELIINDRRVKSFIANDFFSLYPKYNFPRRRYVGFRFSLSEYLKGMIEPIESIELKVNSTEQLYSIVLPIHIRQCE